ncbi:MAG: carboxypeptidase-like regulatory domain-containing protein [Planctomycetota bacterium]
MPLPNLPGARRRSSTSAKLNLRWVPHSILGTVFDETGNPLAGVTVTAQTDRAGAMVEAQSGADGAYMLDGTWQAPVQVRLAPRSGRYLAEPAWWHGDQTPVPLPTYPAGSITGRIPGPSPAAPTSVRCIRIDADPSPAHLTPGQALPPPPSTPPPAPSASTTSSPASGASNPTATPGRPSKSSYPPPARHRSS